MLSKIKQTTVVLSGEVQYVGLRSEMEELLAKHDFAGFVYNNIREGTLKLICEGEEPEIRQLINEIKAVHPEVSISLKEGVVLPKPAGRIVIGTEREIFERLDLGVDRLGTIDGKMASVDKKLEKLEKLDKLGTIDSKLTSMDKKLDTLEDIKGLLKKIAEK